MLEGRDSPFFDTTLVAVVTSTDSSSYTNNSGADWPGHTLTPWRNLRSLRHEVVRSVSHLVPWGLIDQQRPRYWLTDPKTEVPIDPFLIAELFERIGFGYVVSVVSTWTELATGRKMYISSSTRSAKSERSTSLVYS